MTAITLFGLKACDTCRKAVKALTAAGHEVTLRDVRAAPLSGAEAAAFLQTFGEALVNTRSTTWRGLSPEAREAPAETLLAAHPALMKRPVLQTSEHLKLGWTKEVQALFL